MTNEIDAFSISSRVYSEPRYPVPRPSLSWGKAFRADGSTAYWDVERLRESGTNLVSVYYRPLDENGNYRGKSWFIPPLQLKEVMANCQPELAACSALGIRVIGYFDTIQFNADVLEEAGMNPERLYSYSARGERITCDIWDKGNHLSCLANPYWIELLRHAVEMIVRSGFDALMFDLYPYAVDPGLICHCMHCQSRWAAYSCDRFEEAESMNGIDALDFSIPLHREYYRWRLSIFCDFIKEMERFAHALSPSFLIFQNHNADFQDFVFEAMNGGLTNPSSELNQLALGDESSMYLYRLVEASNGNGLYTLINSPDQMTPDYRYRCAFAEAYASGGYFMASTDSRSIEYTRRMFDFIARNEDVFRQTTSTADTAILYSWQDHSFRQSKGDRVSRIVQWQENGARRIAAGLARAGIPYDYVIMDKGVGYSDISKYSTIIVLGNEILDGHLYECMKTYLDHGGNIWHIDDDPRMMSGCSICGELLPAFDKAVSFGEIDSSASQGTRLKGRIIRTVEPTCGASEGEMTVTKVFEEVAMQLNMRAQVELMQNGGTAVEVAVRINKDGTVIHFVRMGNPDTIEDKRISVKVQRESDRRIKRVQVLSPENAEMRYGSVIMGDHICIDIESFENYAIARIEYCQ